MTFTDKYRAGNYDVLHKNNYAKSLLIIFLIFSFIQSFSQIKYVGGTLNESSTWTSDTIYIVTDDLIVPDGIILSIQPGVVVKVDYARGIIVDKGLIKVLGTLSDSVNFMPNHFSPGQTWKWKGIIIRKANDENESRLYFANITGAETAIKIEDSRNVLVDNSSLINCQDIGIQIVNSFNTMVQYCRIENNYNGIEIIAGAQSTSSDNLIYNCIIRNQNHNIFIFGEEGSTNKDNFLYGNLIDSGNDGIRIDNNLGITKSGNIIDRNVIINNGLNIGFGLYLAHDSSTITNNIFWKNNIALHSESGENSIITNNNFYENNLAIEIGPGSIGNSYTNNTFSLNSMEIIGVEETNDIQFRNNNMFYNNGLENIFNNNTSYDISIDLNYWGTTDTNYINQFIYDSHDNPDLGTLYYMPYLSSLDTSNPVSPPHKAIKQFVNNQVRITWHANPEQDILGYRLYNGVYNNYSFSIVREMGMDTTYTFDLDLAITDPIGITAFDSILVNNAQLTGHESPFAFAEIYPYAGNDTIICQYVEKLDINNGTIPMEYQSFIWETSGDGYFEDPELLATSYFPGIMDIQNGGAIISINVTTSDDVRSDSFKLTILDDPIAFAGNDTIVVADSEIELITAYAQNFDSISWFTHGDGIFNDYTLLNPVYIPGNQDEEVGVVIIGMIAYSDCGSDRDSLIINIEPYFSIEGKLWTTQKSDSPGAVIAYKIADEGARALQIESAESDGTFRFENVMIGNYYIYAVPDTNNYDNLAPIYYANKMRWQSAYVLPVVADVYDIDIVIPSVDFILPQGEASISGHMIIPQLSKFNSRIYCAPWFNENNNEFCNGGMSNVTVLLYNDTKKKLLDFTLTDDMGNFTFNNLPYGNYIVDAEKAGYSTIPSSIIYLSPEHNSEAGVILEINQQKIGIYYEKSIPGDISIAVYPNPATNQIFIPYTNYIPLPVAVQIVVYDLFGNQVINQEVIYNESISSQKIDISSLQQGLFFGEILNSNTTIHFRFVKK